MKKNALGLVAIALFAVGCSTLPQDNISQCFGIPCNFSGRLSEDQERNVPQQLRGAFYVESVQDITKSTLAEKVKSQTKLAEEARDGQTYVAIRDYRCVDFGKGVSGQMIVIERYRIKGN